MSELSALLPPPHLVSERHGPAHGAGAPHQVDGGVGAAPQHPAAPRHQRLLSLVPGQRPQHRVVGAVLGRQRQLREAGQCRRLVGGCQF